jgi:hypothetical protein
MPVARLVKWEIEGMAVFTQTEGDREAAPARIPGVTMSRKESRAATTPLMEAATAMVAVSGRLPVFTAMNEGRLPVPEAGRPIAGLLFVQEDVKPGTLLDKTIPAIIPVWHTVWSAVGEIGEGAVST